MSAFVICVMVLTPSEGHGQASTPHPPLRVFLDCFECDSDYLRQNITFIDYMRDRTDADLHILVTTQGTGGGGMSWTVRFIGLGRFESIDRQYVFTTSQDATSDDRRKEFARVFRAGLAGYAADTSVARDLDVTVRAASASSTVPRHDPWRLWVFRVNGNGNVNGEASTNAQRYNTSVSANRVTANLKVNASVSRNESKSHYLLSDGRTVDSLTDSWGVSTLVGKAMGPHFSLGGRVNLSHSSFSNEDRAISLFPGLEYDVFPYSDFENRSFTIWYELGPNYYRYNEVTVYDKLEETITKQQMDISLALRQPWGSLRVFTGISQHIPDWHRYRISLNGSTDVRLFKGFSFNIYASYARIRNQIALPREDASFDEVLLRLQQLQTDYSYFYGLGVSYSFGSIFNSVVNPRFNGQQDFFFF